MDLLSSINEFIKTNNDIEKLSDEFIRLSKKGMSNKHIAIQYDITEFEVMSTLNKYKEETIGTKQAETQISLIPQNDIEQIVSDLNAGEDMESVSEALYLSPNDLKALLAKANYNYYPFINKWTTLSREELCNFFVEQLNNDITLDELSARYFKNQKDKLTFKTNIQLLLQFHKFHYQSSTNKWEKNAITASLPIIADQLNNGHSFMEICKNYQISKKNLFTYFKVYNYYFDENTNKWVNSINTKKDNPAPIINKVNQKSSKNHPIKQETTQLIEDTSISLTSAEILSLKEIVKEWTSRREYISEGVQANELTVFLPKDLNSKLNYAAEKNNSSRSSLLLVH